MENDDVMNVCRLCLGTDSLLSIFDDRIKIPDNMKDVIQTTTGVTITPSDDISHMLCYKCINITIRMFKFRSSSTVNDLELKEKAALRKNGRKLHRSIQSLHIQYPKIVLPSSITKINISPSVSINRNEVNNWRKDYRKKELFEKMMKENLPLNEKTDIEKDIMPQRITNKETTERQVKNLETEMKFAESDVRSSVPKVVIPVPENKSPIGEPSSDNNIVQENYFDNTNIQNQTSTEVKATGKRKLNLSMNEHETKKMKYCENNETDSSINSLLDLKYVNESIFLCDICSKVLYNIKELKKHKNKHMRCCLCKRNFRSLRETQEHSEQYCPIKQIMNNSPIIRLQRCDQSNLILKQYPAAFGIATDEILRDSGIQHNMPHQEEPQRANDEIFFISNEKIVLPTSNNNTDLTCNKVLNTPDASMTGLSENMDSYSASLENRERRNSIRCKPELQITGENVLDLNLDHDEISLVRNLLKRCKENIKESSIQTDVPYNCDIIASPNKDTLFEMKNLREFLKYSKIPVNLSYATKYTAEYRSDLSLLSKYHQFDWSVIKTKRKNMLPTSSNTMEITEDKSTKVINEKSKIVTPSNETPSLFLNGTQSQTPSPNVYAVGVQNVQSNTRKTDSVKQTENISQDKRKNIHTTASKLNNYSSNVENYADVQKNANIHNSANIENNINIQNNTNIQSNASIQSNVNIRSNVNIQGHVNIQSNVNIESNVNIGSNVNVQSNSNIQYSSNAQKKPNRQKEVNTQKKANTQKKTNTHQKKTNIQKNTNIQNNCNTWNVTDAGKTTNVHFNINVQNNVSSNNVSIRAPPTISENIDQTQMNCSKNESLCNQKKLQDNMFNCNATSTNTCSKEVPLGKNTLSLSSANRNNGISYSTQNNHVINGTTFCLTNSSAQAVSNNSFLLTNNRLDTVKTNVIEPLQKYTVVNTNTGVAQAKVANVRTNGSYLVNGTMFNSSNNSIAMPLATITSGISNASTNNSRNLPVGASFNIGNSYLNIPHIAYRNNHETNNIVPTQNNILSGECSKKFSQNLFFLNNIPIVNNQPQTTTFLHPSNTQSSNSSILSQVKQFDIPSTSISINNYMPLPPAIVSQQPTRYDQRTDASGTFTKALNQNGHQSASPTTSSSQWNEKPHFVPLIRVRDVSELR